MTNFYQRLAEPHAPRQPIPNLCTITSSPTDAEYDRPDFWSLRALARVCPDHGIPLDTPIPAKVGQLAMRAFEASCQPRRAHAERFGWTPAVCREDAEGLWEAARRALKGATDAHP